MAYWLLKTEPGTYSADDLARDEHTTWDGVANPTALKHLRSMAVGDEAFVYHTGDERQCVATATVTKAAPGDGSITLKFGSKLKRPITLAEIKSDAAFAGWDLIRLSRLSVVPTSAVFWKRVLALSSAPAAK